MMRIHCVGSAVLWSINKTSLSDMFSKYGVEGNAPTPQQNPEKSRKQGESNRKKIAKNKKDSQ